MKLLIDVKEPFEHGVITMTFVSPADKNGAVDIATSAFTMDELKNSFIIADDNGIKREAIADSDFKKFAKEEFKV